MVLLSLGASSAQAENPFHCEASALRANVAGTDAPEPAVAGRSGECDDHEALPSAGQPGVAAGALVARTEYDDELATGRATGSLADVAIAPATGALPTQQAAAALPPVAVTLPKDLADQLAQLGIPGTVSVDITKAVAAGLPAPALLITADVLRSEAEVTCEGAKPVLTGQSTLTNLKLLDQDVPLDAPLRQTITLLDAQTVDPSALNSALLNVITPLTGASADQVKQVGDVVASAVAGLPPITLPASVADITLTPAEQLKTANALTQRALHATIAIGGRPVLDAVIGEANVSAATADGACAKVAAQSTSLGCSDRKLALLDVIRRNGRVTLIGAADRDYVGRRVAIRLRRTGKVVAHATVSQDGSFRTTAASPPRALMASHTKANSLRYRAEIGREKSLPLKLLRRLTVSSLTSANGKVTVAGRVTRPLTTPVADIRLVRRVSCHKVVLVKRFTPRADGTFRVTVKAPKNHGAAVYRLATRVREQASNPRSYPTFTLPRGVALNTR
ncbi:MAG TPA: hypothetical protein VNT55_08400 [Baekduia sp.]|nr:hypothetical protein [Baekduia sp.]